eukprot:TRINITY_DN6355_c0_g2_i6.p1 TRINITY_DN6355_c0_g2~~TRINITY_DN6355_c0_g2_i6.p1  ORF type:complete len:400 (+),score=-53.00 TRINITY_DN6355_c0_g2_i6:944-2143(+)
MVLSCFEHLFLNFQEFTFWLIFFISFKSNMQINLIIELLIERNKFKSIINNLHNSFVSYLIYYSIGQIHVIFFFQNFDFLRSEYFFQFQKIHNNILVSKYHLVQDGTTPKSNFQQNVSTKLKDEHSQGTIQYKVVTIYIKLPTNQVASQGINENYILHILLSERVKKKPLQNQNKTCNSQFFLYLLNQTFPPQKTYFLTHSPTLDSSVFYFLLTRLGSKHSSFFLLLIILAQKYSKTGNKNVLVKLLLYLSTKRVFVTIRVNRQLCTHAYMPCFHVLLQTSVYTRIYVLLHPSALRPYVCTQNICEILRTYTKTHIQYVCFFIHKQMYIFQTSSYIILYKNIKKTTSDHILFKQPIITCQQYLAIILFLQIILTYMVCKGFISYIRILLKLLLLQLFLS